MNTKGLGQFDREDLRRLLASAEFARSERMAKFLTYLFEHSQDPEAGKRKETEIGTSVFDRPVGYDPKTDSIVRTEATRLRKKLAAYYAGEGATESVRVHLPVGQYKLEFTAEAQAESPPGPADAGAPAAATGEPAPASGPRRTPVLRIAAIAALLSAGAIAALVVVQRPDPPPAGFLQTAPLTALPGGEDFAALPPDGSRIAYVWDGESKDAGLIYVGGWASERPVRLTSQPVAGAAAESYPVWSADGRQIAYLRQAGEGLLDVRLRTMPGGPDESIVQIRYPGPELPGLSLSPDGQWIATAESAGDGNALRLLLVSRITHQKRYFQPVTGLPASRSKPSFSPDGRQIAFVESPDAASADIWVAPFPEGPARKVTHDNRPVNGVAWSPDGDSLIAASYREGNRCGLWRIALDGRPPARLTDPGMQAWNPVISQNHKLVFSRHVDTVNLWRRVGAGPGRLWMTSIGLNSTPRFSHDGKKVAFRSNRSGRSEIWVVDLDKNLGDKSLGAASGEDASDASPRRVTYFNGPVTGSPTWSPDDRWIAFDSRRFGRADVFVIPAAGGAEPRRITNAESNEVVPAWSPDGRYLYYASDREGAWSIWRQPFAGAGSGAAELVRRQAFAPAFGPDGWLYYARGQNDVGLFRSPGDGKGSEEAVIADLKAGMWGNWAVTKSGLYYLEARADGSADLKRRSPSGTVTSLEHIPHPVRWDGGLGVSPDGAMAIWASVDRSDRDLYWGEFPRN